MAIRSRFDDIVNLEKEGVAGNGATGRAGVETRHNLIIARLRRSAAQ